MSNLESGEIQWEEGKAKREATGSAMMGFGFALIAFEGVGMMELAILSLAVSFIVGFAVFHFRG